MDGLKSTPFFFNALLRPVVRLGCAWAMVLYYFGLLFYTQQTSNMLGVPNKLRIPVTSSLRSIMTTTGVARGPVGAAIEAKLTAAFSPTHLEVRNESHMHNV